MGQVARQQLLAYNRIHDDMEELFHELGQRMGLSDSAFAVLYTVCEADAPVTQKQICDMKFMSKQTVNSAIRKLEKAGILYLETRSGKEKDLCLTELGTRLIKEKIAPVIYAEARVFERLGQDEGETLLRLSRQYLQLLREEISQELSCGSG